MSIPKPDKKKKVDTGFDFASTFKESLNGNGNGVDTKEQVKPSNGFDFSKTFQESLKKKDGGNVPTNGLPQSTSQLPLQENKFKGANSNLFLQSLSLNEPITIGGKTAEDFNKYFEKLTAYIDTDITEPSKSTGLLTEDRQKRFEEKKAAIYTKEKEKINESFKKVFYGAIQPEEIRQMQNNPYLKKVADALVIEYAPNATEANVGNTEIIDEAVKNIKIDNRINAVNAERKSIEALDESIANDFTNLRAAKVDLSIGEGASTIEETPLAQLDLNNSASIQSAISQLKNANYITDGKGNKVENKKEELLKTLNDRLFYNVSKQGITPTISQLNDQIQQTVLSKTIREDTDVTNDEKKVNQFKLGLTALEFSNPVLFKTVVNSIAQKQDIGETDFSQIAQVGQEIDNRARFRGGAYNPELIDSETNFDYATFGQKKALASAQIGEWMDDKGYKNVHEFSEKLIRQAAQELGIRKDIENSLVFDEKLGGYDAIPKSGYKNDIESGFMQRFDGINSTIMSWSETPVETYLRSSKLASSTAQKVPDFQGNYSDILPSQREKFTTDMFRGLGQFIPQVLLTKGVGAVLKGGAALSGIATTANQAKNITYFGGTVASTFLQSYGQSYEEHLKKTGDSNTAALIGTIDGIVSGAFETILPDAKLADKAFGGLKKGLANDLVGLVKKGGDITELPKVARPYVEKFVKNALNISAQENLEELGTQAVDFITESIFDPESAKDRNLNKELWDVAKSTFAAMSIPAILGAGGSSFQKDFTIKSLHSNAINYDKTKESLQKSLDKEYINQDEFNKAVQILSTHRESINAAPEVNADGKNLNTQEKLDYAYENTKIKVYKDKADKAASAVEKSMWEGKIKEAEKIQEEILIPSQSKIETDEKAKEAQETKGQDELLKEEGVVETTAPLRDLIAPFLEEVTQPIYKNVLSSGNENMVNDTLKEVAQQANASEGEKRGAISAFGENIVRIAQEKFPNENVDINKEGDLANFEKENKKGEPVDVSKNKNIEPTQQEIFDDIKNKRFTTAEYNSESDIPDVWKDKVSSSGETNGKKIFRVTLPTSQFEYESKTGISKKVTDYPTERIEQKTLPSVDVSIENKAVDILLNKDERAIDNEYLDAALYSLAGNNSLMDAYNVEAKQKAKDLIQDTELLLQDANVSKQELKDLLTGKGESIRVAKEVIKERLKAEKQKPPVDVSIENKNVEKGLIPFKANEAAVKNDVKNILDISDEKAEVLSILYHSDLTPAEKKILNRQYNNGVMDLADIKKYAGVLDMDKIKSGDIDKWARAELEKRKGRNTNIKAEDIDFEEIKNEKQKPSVDVSTVGKIPETINEIVDKLHNPKDGITAEENKRLKSKLGTLAEVALAKNKKEKWGILAAKGSVTNLHSSLKSLLFDINKLSKNKFTPQEFEDIATKYANSNKDYLHEKEKTTEETESSISTSKSSAEISEIKSDKGIVVDKTPEPKIGKFEAKAREIVAKKKEIVIPQWLINTDPTIKKQGLDAASLNRALDEAIIAVGKALDRSVELIDAIKEGADNLIKDYRKGLGLSDIAKLKPELEKQLRDGFDNHYRENILGEEPPKPPIDNTQEDTKKEEPKKIRSVYKNIINRSKLTPEQKDILRNDPNALYTVLPNETAKQIALDIIQDMGVEVAVAEASRKNSELEPVERVMILGAAMDYYAGRAKSAKGNDFIMVDLEIDANEKMQEVAKELGGLGTAYGRAINIFNEIYKLSNLALERKLKKNVDEINKLRNPQANENAKAVENIVKDVKNINGIGNEMTETDLQREADTKKKISDLEKEVADLRKQIKNVTDTKTGTKKNPLKINRVTNDTEYDKRVKEFKSRARTGINKDDLSDLTYFGLYHLENGLTKFADWVKVMSAKFGKFKDQFKQIYSNIRQDAIDKGEDKNLFDSDDIVDNDFQKFQDESDAKKIVNATKRLAAAKIKRDVENDPDKARIIAPRRAAERIRKDAAVSLDLVTTKNEQTYLKKLINVVQNKAREYYKETKEKVSNVNDWLQFAIANGKADIAIWTRTQDEVESQIDADENLSDEEKQDVKDFLTDYQQSIFDTLLTTGQKEEIIRQKLIDAGYSQERTINGKVVKAVDWNKVIGSAKNIKEAKAAIVKSITDLGYTQDEAANEINSILNDFDNKVIDRKTRAVNAYLNKGVLNKVKNALGLKGKGKVQKLIEMNNKGILDDTRVKDVLAQDLGIISLTDEDLAKVRELSEKIDKATVPFIKKKYEEQLQYLFDSKSGNLTYLENREFVMNNRLTSLWNQIQNLTGYFRILSTYITTSIKTGSPIQTAKVFRKQWKDGVSDALTVLMGGHVSRGTAFSDLTRSTEGEARVRYLEQGKGKLLGLPDFYLRVGNRSIQINPVNALYRKIKYVGRLMEAADTIPSNVISGITQYWQIKKQLELLNPELSSQSIEQKTYDTMYSMDVEKATVQAVKDLKESGVENPTRYEINRASHEIVERKRNEIIAKEFYDTVERLKPIAETKLREQGNENITDEDIVKQVYSILGRDEPLDIVARGERQALRETGKKTTAGITSLVLMPIDGVQQKLKEHMLERHGQAGKAAYNIMDATFNQLLPFANSIGRWIEMGLELTPYGILKGLGYKVYGASSNIGGKDKLNPVELSELGDDYIIRGIQGTAQTLLAMFFIGLLKGKGDDDEDDKITGQYQGKNYPQQKIKEVGHPDRSLDINGRKFPLDLIGNAAYPLMMYSDFTDRRTDENERHGILYTTAAMYLTTAAQSAYSRLGNYGSIVQAVIAGKEEKYLPKLGTIGGQYLGAQFIPFNRFQQELGELWNPKSNQSITFGENLLQQFSIMGGFNKNHPAFDYRGREYDKGDIWVGSPDGVVKMFTKSKSADNIDMELAEIDFGATDAFRETKDEENYKYTIESKEGKRRFMTNEEYYKFRRETGNQFNSKLAKNFDIIQKLTIRDKEGKIDEEETNDAKREAFSNLLTKSKENALALIQSQTGNVVNPIQEKIEKRQENKFILMQKKMQLQGVDNK